jgi:hypothetical protein
VHLLPEKEEGEDDDAIIMLSSLSSLSLFSLFSLPQRKK